MTMIDCDECNVRISDKAHTCVCCGAPVPEKAQENDNGVDEYLKKPCALKFILLLTFILLAPLFCILAWRDITGKWDEILFLGYCIFFLATWIIYFISVKPKGESSSSWYVTRTLRRLLGEASLNWDPYINERDGKEVILTGLEDSFRRKAGASMQVIAIFIAISALELNIVSNAFSDPNRYDVISKMLVLTLAGVFGLVSFVCFVISVDALDVVFNKFRTNDDRHIIIHHFYTKTIYPKYIGLVSMISGAIFIIAYHDYLFGSFAISMTLLLGYHHWFPNIKKTGSETEDCKICYFFHWVVLIILVVIPVGIKLALLFNSTALKG